MELLVALAVVVLMLVEELFEALGKVVIILGGSGGMSSSLQGC